MKTNRILFALVISVFQCFSFSAFSQGSLTPPGAPAATMKTLDQIEARTPISSAPFTISNSGSYYLTQNVTVTTGNAIMINADNVTLDLNGFTISSTAPSATGTGVLFSSGRKNVTIVNGFITGGVIESGGGFSGSGFSSGISSSGTSPASALVSRVSVAGVLSLGIYLGFQETTAVESCTVRTAGNLGIVASLIKNSVAVLCGSNAIEGAVIADCGGISVGSGSGVSAGKTASNCYGSSNTGNGLVAGNASNCVGQSFGSGYGVLASIATNCQGTSGSGGHGVRFTEIGNMCYGFTTGVGFSYVLGNGAVGPLNLP